MVNGMVKKYLGIFPSFYWDGDSVDSFDGSQLFSVSVANKASA